jgi:hypothetical protein
VFRKQIQEDHGISWAWIKSHSKSWKAEKGIQYAKRQLSQMMLANGNHLWVRLVPALMAEYNDRLIPGTSIRRRDVNQHNYLRLLSELYKSTDPTALFNISSSNTYPSPLERLIWRFEVGQKVTLARRVDYSISKRSTFEKPSVAGVFGSKIYTITDRAAKNNWRLFICPVYALSDMPGSWYYESEIREALFADTKEKQRADRLRRFRKKRAVAVTAAAAAQ